MKFQAGIVLILFVFSSFASAQHEHHMMKTEEEQADNPASQFLVTEGAGTAVNPESSPMHMGLLKGGDWKLMYHGYVFLNFIQQSGPRGDDKVFSTNHLMFMARREFDPSSAFLFRGMMSLEPATITDKKYPLLFQTGETAFGEPIVDGQHPHDLFMEISVQYVRQLNSSTLVHLYGSLIGDPALGPVAYPHRISAQELPQASLSHHLQDSSHIVSDVFTAGLKYKWARFEFSGFHGAEPDEDRWDIDQGAIDSWSTRLTLTPTPNLAAQVSTGHLIKPEELEPGNIQRTTASVTWNHPTSDGFWATSFVYGGNHKELEDRFVHSFLVETLWQFQHRNRVTGRFEAVDKDELFADHLEINHELGGQVFRINAFTFGYARDFAIAPRVQAGIGANVTFYSIPSTLTSFYGDHPRGFLLYFRIQPGHSGGHNHKKE